MSPLLALGATSEKLHQLASAQKYSPGTRGGPQATEGLSLPSLPVEKHSLWGGKAAADGGGGEEAREGGASWEKVDVEGGGGWWRAPEGLQADSEPDPQQRAPLIGAGWTGEAGAPSADGHKEPE